MLRLSSRFTAPVRYALPALPFPVRLFSTATPTDASTLAQSASAPASPAAAHKDAAASAASAEAAAAAAAASGFSASQNNPAPVQLTGQQQYELKVQYYAEQERRLASAMDRMRSSSGTMAGAYAGAGGGTSALTRRPGQRSKDVMARVHAAMDYKARVTAVRKEEDEARTAKETAEEEAAANATLFEKASERATDASGKAKSWFNKFF